MKRWLLSVLLVSFSFAQEQPSWIKELPHKDNMTYSVGMSNYYLVDDGSALKHSKENACQMAMDELSRYIGIRQSVEQTFSTTLDGGKVENKINMKSKGSSDQLLMGIKPLETYIEYSENGENFRTWCLLGLDSATEQQIRSEIKKDSDGFEKTLQELLEAIDTKNYSRAETLFAVAKGFRASGNDDRLDQVEKRLKELLKNQLNVFISTNKKSYHPDEDISISLSVTHDSFVYLFYFDGYQYEMLFPSTFVNMNKMLGGNMIDLPTDRMRDEGAKIIAYRELKNGKGELIAVASKKNLVLQSLFDEQGEFFNVYLPGKQWEQKIKQCLTQGECVQKKTDVFVQKDIQRAKIALSCSNSSELEKNVCSAMSNYFREEGIEIVTKHPSHILKMAMSHKSGYSQLMKMDVDDIVLEATLSHTGIHGEDKKIRKSLRFVGSHKDEITTGVQKLARDMAAQIKTRLF